MASKRPTTIAEHIRAAAREGQPNLGRLCAILKSVAPEASEAIKWGTPFFVGDPIPVRFLRAQGAHQLLANRGGVGAISQGTGKAQDYQGHPSDSLQQVPARGSGSQDR